jgi:hypothetical protein
LAFLFKIRVLGYNSIVNAVENVSRGSKKRLIKLISERFSYLIFEIVNSGFYVWLARVGGEYQVVGLFDSRDNVSSFSPFQASV